MLPPPLPTTSATLLVGAMPPPPGFLAPIEAVPPTTLPVDEPPALKSVAVTDSPQEDWHEFSGMAISTAVHAALFLLLALLIPEAVVKPPAVQIVSAFNEPEADFEEFEMIPLEIPEVVPEEIDEPLPEVPADIPEVEAADVDTAGSFDPSDIAAFAGPLDDPVSGANALLADLGSLQAGGGPGGGGGFGGEIGRRLSREGASSGAVQVSLSWNNFDDLDLHVVPPSGEEIFFGRPRSQCRGTLDVDMNAGGRRSDEPVENVFWARRMAPVGNFQVFVHLFARHDEYDQTPFEVHVLVDGVKRSYKGVVTVEKPTVMVTEFQRKRGGSSPAAVDDEFRE